MLEPCAMDAVTGTKKIAMPDALQTDKEMTMIPRINELQLVRKFDEPSRSDAVDFPRPFRFRPGCRGEKDDLMARRQNTMRHAPQIDFGAAARRQPAENNSHLESFLRH